MELNTAIDLFKAHQLKMEAYSHAINKMCYDSETVMPCGASEDLGRALGILSEESYKLLVNDELREYIAVILAHRNDVSFQVRREAEELNDELTKLGKIPMEEYVEFQVVQNEANHVWHSAKVNDDYASFEPLLSKLLDFQKRFALYYEPDKDAYDTWLNEFEKGLSTEVLDTFFADVRAKLVPLIKRIGKAKQPDDSFLNVFYPLEVQKKLSDYLMQTLTIERGYCGIGEAEHPFTTEFNKHDVRITTHYHEYAMASSMFSVIHECGHALYELNIGDELIGSSLGGGSSMGIHEGQSRFFENMIGRSEAFIEYIFPKLLALFPVQLADVSAHSFYLAINKSAPSLIRTEADELTYSLHIMVRYELEKRLFNGTLTTKELPEAWNALYYEYLGVTVPSNREGVLQDSHWAGGSFGYFPSYSIGSAYSAQIFAAMQKDIDIYSLVKKGNLSPIVEWLTARIYKHGQLLKPDELIQSACGAPFDPIYYTDYLIKKFNDIYGFNS
ncbi:MAG: carboxypeptidase M32 [Clostridia bacterium]